MAAPSKTASTLFALALGFLLSLPAPTWAQEDAPAPDEEDSAEEAPAPKGFSGTLGGVGLIGFHFGEALRAEGTDGRWLDFGGGLEVGLGGSDSRLAGRIRFYYMGVLDLDGEGVRHNGVLSAGLGIQLLKATERPFGLYALIDAGVSPLVTELRVFVFADVGVGVRYRPTERLELYAEGTAFIRLEKSLSAGPLFYLGARVRL